MAHLFRLPVPPAVVDNDVIQILRHKQYTYQLKLTVFFHTSDNGFEPWEPVVVTGAEDDLKITYT